MLKTELCFQSVYRGTKEGVSSPSFAPFAPQKAQDKDKKLPDLPQGTDDHRTAVTLNETKTRRVGSRHQEKWRPGDWGLFSGTFL